MNALINRCVRFVQSSPPNAHTSTLFIALVKEAKPVPCYYLIKHLLMRGFCTSKFSENYWLVNW